MIKTKKVSIIFLITVLILTASVSAGPQDKIQNMNFNNAAVVDVLRAVAEVADVNLITDSEVSGNITVNLKDITFQKALTLITQTRSLAYKWDEDTVVVASPERLENIYADIKTEFVKVDSRDFDNIGTIVKEIFPETQITLDTARQQFILKGENQNIKEIKEMITRLDNSKTAVEIESEERVKEFEEKEIDIYSESYKVLNSELADLQDKLTTVNPDLEVKANPLTEIITINGEKERVKEALAMAEAYDISLEPETRNIRVDYVDTEQITEIVGKFYPEIKLHVNAKRKEIIINGAKNKLNGVENLIEEINRPQHQVIIETRVEEISSDKLKELGIDLSGNDSLTKIHFIKDKSDPAAPAGNEYGQIEGIELTWPNFFRALEKDNISKTLANPRLMTLNGEEATMSIIDEVPSPNYNDEGMIQSYTYEKAGIELTFTPWITDNNEIELKINPSVSSFGVDPEGPEPPPRKTRSVDTRLRLKNGETFAIGGLIQEEESEAMSKIPLLGDLPLLGQIFKTQSGDDTRTELLIFVTPKIINYGEIPDNSESLYSKEVKSINEDSKRIQEDNTNISLDKSKDEIIADYLKEKKKTREDVLSEYKSKDKETAEFEGLTAEELEAILDNN